MHAHGIEVFNGADDDDVVGEVAHHLELVFLPAEDALFDQALVDGRKIEAAGEDLHQLFAVVGDAAARAAEREAGADEDREADLAGEVEAVAQVVDQRGLRNFEADADHRVFEEQAVFGLLDGFKLGADELDVVAIENAGVGQIDGEVERRLAADGRQQGEFAGVGLRREHLRFNADDLFDVFVGERLDVGAVGQLGIGHDGGRVRVDQHDLVALLPEGLAGLRAGVVELGRLADDDRAGADHEDLLNVISAWHGLVGYLFNGHRACLEGNEQVLESELRGRFAICAVFACKAVSENQCGTIVEALAHQLRQKDFVPLGVRSIPEIPERP